VEQLIIVGIVVLFSILEAVARKNRQGQGQGEGVPLPEEPPARRSPPRPRPQVESPTGSVPHSYDEDPSFDEAAKGDEARRRPEPAAAEVPAPAPARSRTSSEGMLPAEIWEEIQGLARGEHPDAQKPPVPTAPPPFPAPAPVQPRPTMSRPPGWLGPSAPRPRGAAGEARPSQRVGAPTAQPRAGKGLGRPPSRTVEGAPAMEGTADHPVHLAHEAFGTAPSRRAGIPLEGESRRGPAAGEAVRKLLSPNRDSLRQAMILQEILGPPPGLRDG
jgi:hypothetical protein